MTETSRRRGVGARVAVAAIGVYQKLVSPLLGRNCRFSPTCSAYAAEAVGRFGLRRGGLLALRRLGRCQPLGPSGYDPVPSEVA